MYINGTIVISDENGMKPAIPYVDNIEDVLVLENEIEFLEKCLKEDQEKLESKKMIELIELRIVNKYL